MRIDLYLFWIGYSNHCFFSTTLQPCFRCTLLILKRSHCVMFVASSHFLESCPKQYLPLTRCWLCRIESSTIPMSMSSAGAPENSNGRDIWWGLFLGWLVARDAFPKNYGNPTKHKEGDHIELLALCICIYIYHVLVGILHFEIPLGDFESWVNINLFRDNLLMYTYWNFIIQLRFSNLFGSWL